MSNLKEQLIKLGYSHPELRDHLRPVLDDITKRTAGVHLQRRSSDEDSIFDLVTGHCDSIAKICQKILRKVPNITAHRITSGEGTEKVTVKDSRTKASVKVGLDACDIHQIKYTCTISISGEVVTTEQYPGDMDKTEVAESAANLLLTELGIQY